MCKRHASSRIFYLNSLTMRAPNGLAEAVEEIPSGQVELLVEELVVVARLARLVVVVTWSSS